MEGRAAVGPVVLVVSFIILVASSSAGVVVAGDQDQPAAGGPDASLLCISECRDVPDDMHVAAAQAVIDAVHSAADVDASAAIPGANSAATAWGRVRRFPTAGADEPSPSPPPPSPSLPPPSPPPLKSSGGGRSQTPPSAPSHFSSPPAPPSSPNPYYYLYLSGSTKSCGGASSVYTVTILALGHLFEVIYRRCMQIQS